MSGSFPLNYIPGVGYVFASPGGFSMSLEGLGDMGLPGTCFMPGACPQGITYSGLGSLIPHLPSPCSGDPVPHCGTDQGNGFSATTWAGPIICVIAEPCGAVALFVGVLGGMLFLTGDNVHLAQNVADTGIMEEVYEMIRRNPGMTICDALDALMAAAAGNSARQQKIKATQKFHGCRRSSQS